MDKNFVSERLGRLKFERPAGLEHYGTSATIQGVLIRSFSWPLPPRDDFDSVWNSSNIAEADEVWEERDGGPGWIEVEPLLKEERTWVGRSFFDPDHTPQGIAMWRISPMLGLTLRLRSAPTMQHAENVLKNLASSFKFQVADQEDPHNFFLREGAFKLLDGGFESARSGYGDRSDQRKLFVAIEYSLDKTDIKTHSLVSRTKGILERAASFSDLFTAKKLRLETKSVNGLSGEEAIILVREKGKTNVEFSGKYHSKDELGSTASIDIKMETTGECLEEEIAIWDEIISSLSLF